MLIRKMEYLSDIQSWRLVLEKFSVFFVVVEIFSEKPQLWPKMAKIRVVIFLMSKWVVHFWNKQKWNLMRNVQNFYFRFLVKLSCFEKLTSIFQSTTVFRENTSESFVHFSWDFICVYSKNAPLIYSLKNITTLILAILGQSWGFSKKNSTTTKNTKKISNTILQLWMSLKYSIFELSSL